MLPPCSWHWFFFSPKICFLQDWQSEKQPGCQRGYHHHRQELSSLEINPPMYISYQTGCIFKDVYSSEKHRTDSFSFSCHLSRHTVNSRNREGPAGLWHELLVWPWQINKIPLTPPTVSASTLSSHGFPEGHLQPRILCKSLNTPWRQYTNLS